MHACGHDGHTAILLGVAEIVRTSPFIKRKRGFIFQYGEEIMPGGSQEMIDDGCLNGVDKIYGTHLWVVTVLEQYIQDLVLLWHHQMNSQLQSR